MPPLVYRPLGATEASIWLRDAYRDRQGQAPSALHFALVAQISGRLDNAALRPALDRLQRHYPLLRVNIVPQHHGYPCFIEQAAPIPYRVVSRTSAHQWQVIVAQELLQPFDSAIAPLMRVTLLQGCDHSDLIVTCHHAIADGLTGVNLIRDLLTLVGNTAGAIATPLPVSPPLEALLPDSVSISWGERWLAQGMIALQQRRSQLIRRWQRVPEPIIHCSPRVEAGRFSPALTTQLRYGCRQQETTVHGALCAALLMAIAAGQPTGAEHPLTCFSPINLRPYLQDTANFLPGVYISPGRTEHRLTLTTRFWDLARSVKTGLMNQIEPHPLRQLAKGHELLTGSHPWPETVCNIFLKHYAADCMVTNLGLLNLAQDFGTLRLEALYGPVVLSGFAQERVLGVLTLNNQLYYTFLHHPGAMVDGTHEDRVELIAAIIQQALNDTDLALATVRSRQPEFSLVTV